MKVKGQVLNEENEGMLKNHEYTLKYVYEKYSYYYKCSQNHVTVYSILAEMAKNHPYELIQIWNEIQNTGVLHFDKDDPLYIATNIWDEWLVYEDTYKVDKIEDGKVYFEKLRRK